MTGALWPSLQLRLNMWKSHKNWDTEHLTKNENERKNGTISKTKILNEDRRWLFRRYASFIMPVSLHFLFSYSLTLSLCVYVCSSPPSKNNYVWGFRWLNKISALFLNRWCQKWTNTKLMRSKGTIVSFGVWPREHGKVRIFSFISMDLKRK